MDPNWNINISTNGSNYSSSSFSVTSGSTITGQVMWNGQPVIDDDDGGSAPVREPRKPKPHAPSGAMALEPESELALCAV